MNQAIDPGFGVHEPPAVALIDEARCIGCTLCIQACPVDAIVGAAQHMHTVISAECTGCRLCLPPCPVDCIEMVMTGMDLSPAERLARAAHARQRSDARTARLERERKRRHAGLAPAPSTAEEKKRATVKRAIERARARLKRHAGR
jgi:electron transport complex protein RnfB